MELINRELSWLSFNDRVLQEALDDQVPVVERMRFLGIYSNNMDEFYRVRVANVRRMIALKKHKADGFNVTPTELYQEIRQTVINQQLKFDTAYKRILLALSKEKIQLIDETKTTITQKSELSVFFHENLYQHF